MGSDVYNRGCVVKRERVEMSSSSLQRQVISFEEICKHNHREDCWILIAAKVYNVTKFMDDHPGGDSVLLTSTGKDATEDFDGIGHGDAARRMMNDFYVADFDISTLPEQTDVPKQRMKLPAVVPPMPKKGMRPGHYLYKIFLLLLPLLIFILAFSIHKFSQSN